MAAREGTRHIGLQMTEEEAVALDNFARQHKLDKAVVIRAALQACIENFPSDIWNQDIHWRERGKFEFKCPVVKKS